VLHFQSGLWLEDYGVAISESFVVGALGAERLCVVTRAT
jgi:ectoine hydrolase